MMALSALLTVVLLIFSPNIFATDYRSLATELTTVEGSRSGHVGEHPAMPRNVPTCEGSVLSIPATRDASQIGDRLVNEDLLTINPSGAYSYLTFDLSDVPDNPQRVSFTAWSEATENLAILSVFLGSQSSWTEESAIDALPDPTVALGRQRISFDNLTQRNIGLNESLITRGIMSVILTVTEADSSVLLRSSETEFAPHIVFFGDADFCNNFQNGASEQAGSPDPIDTPEPDPTAESMPDPPGAPAPEPVDSPPEVPTAPAPTVEPESPPADDDQTPSAPVTNENDQTSTPNVTGFVTTGGSTDWLLVCIICFSVMGSRSRFARTQG